jgi:hypothetical protein
LPALNKHGLAVAGGGAVLALAALFWGAADALLGLKAAVAAVFALGIGAAAVFHLIAETRTGAKPRWRLALGVLALGLLSLLVLSRGAPHNNPALYAVYAEHGARGLVLAGAALVAFAVMAGAALNRRSAHTVVAGWRQRMSEPAFLRCAVASLALLAALAALEPVVRFWDVPGWGDSIFYDYIAQRIALGLMPAGHSYYMPVFQYGSALLYYLFGHFFFVQQLANVAFAPVTVVLLCLSAWNLFRSPWAVLLTGALAATDDVLRHAPHMQQIENWYVPVFCLSIFAATRYFRDASRRNLVYLALAAGLVFNLRTQGAFFVGFLLLAPFFLRGVALRERLREVTILAVLFAATLVPWTARNALVEGRFSPVGTQGAHHIAFSNDLRIFYGIRRDLARAAAAPAEARPAAGGAIARILQSPGLLIEAAPWRALAFYGLLPPGVWDKAGPRPTDWTREGKEYALRVFPVLSLLIASALGLLLNPGRATLFLAGAILGNLAVVLFVGFSEPRLSFPVLALHILLAGAAVFAPRLEFVGKAAPAPFRLPKGSRTAAAAVLVAAVVAHLALGKPHLLRALTAPRAGYDEGVSIDAGLPDLADLVPARLGERREIAASSAKGRHVRATVAVTNNHQPVKYYAFPLPEYPDFTADPATDTYYLTYLLDASGAYDRVGSRQIGIGFRGAILDRPLREEDVVEVEGEVLDIAGWGVVWMRAEKVRWLRGPDFGPARSGEEGAGAPEGVK